MATISALASAVNTLRGGAPMMSQPVTWAAIVSTFIIFVMAPLAGLLWVSRAYPDVWVSVRTEASRWRNSWRGLPYAGLALSLALLVASVGLPLTSFIAGSKLQDSGLTGPALVLLTIPIVAAVGEELLFRGILLGWLQERMPWGVAVATQAAFFGLLHFEYGSPTHIAVAASSGVVFAFAAKRWGLLAAMVAHASLDVVVVLVTLSGEGTVEMSILAVALVLSVASMGWLAARRTLASR